MVAACSLCVWGKKHNEGAAGLEFLTCQYHAPKDSSTRTAFPMVRPDDFCREWEPVPDEVEVK
jgi:hypothetical protein